MNAPAPIDLAAYPCTVAPLPPEDGGGYVARFSDIPGCLGVGASEEEARADGLQALFACIDALKASDRVPPEPGSAKG